MSGEIELFYDDTPGERRAMAARDGRFELILVERDDQPVETRLGARLVGRVRAVEPGLRGAFVDTGVEGRPAFLPFGRDGRPAVGEAFELEVTAEPRESKGAVVRRLGSAQGAPRLIQPPAGLKDQLRAEARRRGASQVEIQTGVAAIRASWDAEAEARADGGVFPAFGLDLSVQRTRALIAVDIDFAPLPGRDARKGRAEANREGLRQAARLIALKRWGGLAAIDLAGDGTDGAQATTWAREAFSATPDVAYGPLSRFGLMQLSLPWRRTPIEEALRQDGLRGEAVALCRTLRHALLADTTAARIVAVARPDLVTAASPLVAQLGPRAGLRPDPSVAPGREFHSEV